MGQEGRRLAEQEFSSDEISRQTISLYEEMMATARR
jgi:glycosyltransferase involved in cell wall biosynthesis